MCLLGLGRGGLVDLSTKVPKVSVIILSLVFSSSLLSPEVAQQKGLDVDAHKTL